MDAIRRRSSPPRLWVSDAHFLTTHTPPDPRTTAHPFERQITASSNPDRLSEPIQVAVIALARTFSQESPTVTRRWQRSV
jgi:hypothetical protein